MISFGDSGLMTVIREGRSWIYPMTIIQQALYCYSSLGDARGDEAVRGSDFFSSAGGRSVPDPESVFRKVLEQLMESRVEEGQAVLWEVPFAVPRYGCTPPWRSAMIQGQALSLLVRAAEYLREPKYAEMARGVYVSLTGSGGSGFALEEDEGVWFEEYVGSLRSHVLNGFLFTAWGIYDYALFSGEKAAFELWERCLSSAGRRLPEYEWGLGSVLWTVYDLRYREPCSSFYHRLHCDLLGDFVQVTGDDTLGRFESRWRKALKNRLAVWVLVRMRNAGLKLSGAR